MKRYGLIGYPLSHSFSEKFFSEKFKINNNKDCIYQNFPIDSITKLPELLNQYPDIRGLNVTIPYKQLILSYLHSVENIPTTVNACNCIKIENGKLVGYNTDIIGFEKSLIELLKPHHTNALILGSGGATEAVMYVLEKIGINYKIVSRKRNNSSSLTYSDIDEDKIVLHSIIINTTPLGMFPKTDESPNIPYEFITHQHLCFDLIYNPEKTLFLKKAEEKGAIISNGHKMLKIQAEESWNIWNSR